MRKSVGKKTTEQSKTARAVKLERKQTIDNLPTLNLCRQEPPKPIDWPHWRRQAEVELWEAVFLSLEINPEIDRHYSDFIGEMHRDWQAEIYKCLRTLRGSLSDRNHFSPGVLNIEDPDLCGVRLPEFAAWCASVGYEIPEELAAMSQSPCAEPDAKSNHVESAAEIRNFQVGKSRLTNSEFQVKSRSARWWQADYEVMELAALVGARLDREGKRTSNRAIADGIASEIEIRERRGQKRTVDGGTIRNTILTGWKYVPD